MSKNLTDLAVIQETVGRINNLTEQSQRQWGKMSVNQMLAHCADQMLICYEEKPAKRFGNFITEALARLWLKVSASFPRNIRTLPELDPNKNIMAQPITFEQDRQAVIALVEKFFDLPNNHVYQHPLLGKATKTDIGKLIYVHLDHHLKQFGV